MTALDTALSAMSQTTHRLRLVRVTALVVGSTIGAGVFGLPYPNALFGLISQLALALTSVGALNGWITIGAVMPRAAGRDGCAEGPKVAPARLPELGRELLSVPVYPGRRLQMNHLPGMPPVPVR